MLTAPHDQCVCAKNRHLSIRALNQHVNMLCSFYKCNHEIEQQQNKSFSKNYCDVLEGICCSLTMDQTSHSKTKTKKGILRNYTTIYNC